MNRYDILGEQFGSEEASKCRSELSIDPISHMYRI